MLLNPILLFFLISFILSILIYMFITYKLHDYLRSAHNAKYREIYPARFVSEVKFILSDNDLGDDKISILKKKCKKVIIFFGVAKKTNLLFEHKSFSEIISHVRV